MKLRTSLLLIFLIGAQEKCFSYDIGTHGAITKEAAMRSVLDDDNFLREGLGLSSQVTTVSEAYYDVAGNEIGLRVHMPFEDKIIEDQLKVDPLSIKGWLMRGAIREDDVPYLFGKNPQDDPYGQIFRVLHHFYDPRNDRGLRVGLRIGQKAPDWGVGASDAFADENAVDQWRRNHFTVFDAREAMFRALTGMDRTGSKAIVPDSQYGGAREPNNPQEAEAARKAYWATTFRALGDLVHLIQDMAQPQHTRNDPHAGKGYDGEAGPQGHASFYEKYIEARAAQTEVVESNGHRYTPDTLVYDNGYPIPRFNSYVAYFSTQHLESSVTARKGMADYSNRGFFSIGKNLGQGDYDLPPNSISGGFYSPEPRVVNPDGATVHLLKGSVSDAQAGTTDTDVPLTAFGAWNDALQQTTEQQSFTLIRENYDAMAGLLIPRAVAYSAGLIDYFFRGRMEISLPDEGVYAILDHAVENASGDGFRKIKLKVRNATPPIGEGLGSQPQDMSAGTLWAVVKFQRNGCYQPDLSGEPGFTDCDIAANRGPEEIVVSGGIAVQSLASTQPQSFEFDFSQTPIPINAVNVVLQIVYRGVLGSERDAVVVATKDISEPTFLSFLSKSHLANRFNCGGNTLGLANTMGSYGIRFAVLADYPSIRINVYQINLNKWLVLDVLANRHQYNTGTGSYDFRFSNGEPDVVRYWGFIQHFALIYGADDTLFDTQLDNLSPYPIEIYF